jgi:hypothetical protein
MRFSNRGNPVATVRPEAALTKERTPTTWGILRDRSRPDWRGWIALIWVIVWGWAYAIMAFHARAPQVLAWLRSWTAGH